MTFTGSAGQSSMNREKPNLGKGNKLRQMPNFTPEQMELFRSQFANVAPDSFTARMAGGDQSAFEQMEQPALQQFSGMQGQMASRFSQGGGGAGSMGARKSSGFQNSMNQANSNFAQTLASNRQGLQRQAMQDLMSMSNTLMGRKPYENYVERKPQSFGNQILGGLVQSIPAVAGGLAMGPAGAALGAGAGNWMKNLWGGQQGNSGGLTSAGSGATAYGGY